jgi:hypothetical protein
MAAADVFVQYGALGGTTTVALVALRFLFKRESQLHDDMLQAERTRADRLEKELSALNEVVRTQYVATLGDATRAIQDALASVRRRSR